MKKKLFQLVFIFSIKILCAQNTPLSWSKRYGGQQNDNLYSAKKTADGSIILAGTSNSNNRDILNNHGGDDIILLKLDSNKNIVWQKSYGGSGNDRIAASRSFQVTPDGGYIFAGMTNSSDGDVIRSLNTNCDIWVTKLDAQGNIVWQKIIVANSSNISGVSNLTAVRVLSNGDYIVSGGGDNNMKLIKLSSTGNILWQATYPTANFSNTAFVDMQPHINGFILVGTVYNNYYSSKTKIINVDTNGNIIWQNDYSYQNLAFTSAQAMEVLSDGNFIFSLKTGTYNGDDQQKIVKMSPTGNILLEKQISSSGKLNTFMKGDNDNYYLCGSCWESRNFCILKIDSDGNLLKSKTISPQYNKDAQTYDMIEDGSGIPILAASTNGNEIVRYQFPLNITEVYWSNIPPTNYEILLIKLVENSLGTNDEYKNFVNFYPNPVKDKLNFEGSEKISKIKVYSADSKLVLEKRGVNMKFIDLSSLYSGNYLVEITDFEGKTIVKKIIKE